MRTSRKYPNILNGISAIAFLVVCLGLIAILVRFGGTLGGWFATHTDLIQAGTALLGITGLIAGILSYLWQRKLRTDDFPFAVVSPFKYEEVLPTIFRVSDIKNPLSAHYVPYQTGRERGDDIQSKIRELLQSKKRLIIKGPTGVGKTREGGELATTLCKEGWAIIVLKKEGERIWLGRPEKWPPIDEKRLVVFLDDLHTLCNPAIQSQPPLADKVPFAPNPPFQDRLKKFLEFLEEFVGDKVLVIATARSESEQWRKLDPNNPFWDNFAQYEIRRFTDESAGRLLGNYGKQLGVTISGQAVELASKTDRMAETLVANVVVAFMKQHALDFSSYKQTAEGNYRQVYKDLREHFPADAEAIGQIYDATFLVNEVGLPTYETLVIEMATGLSGARGLARLKQRGRIHHALSRLLSQPRWWEKQGEVLTIRDGVLEGKEQLPNPFDYLDKIIKVAGQIIPSKGLRVEFQERQIAVLQRFRELEVLAGRTALPRTALPIVFSKNVQLRSSRQQLVNAYQVPGHTMKSSRRIVLAEFFCTDEVTLLFGMRAGWGGPEVVEVKQPRSEVRKFVCNNFGWEEDSEKKRATLGKVRAIDLDEWQARFAPFVEPILKWAEPGDYLYLVPHDVLHYLPLHTLKVDGRYLIERNPVIYTPSASVLKYCQAKRKGRRETALVLGDSDAENPLPYAYVEALQVAEVFGAEPYLGQAARKSLVKEKLEKERESIDILHFACYGYFHSSQPLKSGILMAPDVEKEELDEIGSTVAAGLPTSRYLTVEEISSMEMQADLVTLSLSVSGVNQLRPGDELIGMTRAFIYAGASSLIVSLWAVNEISSSILMQRFYKALKDGKTKVEALQFAQLAVKNLTASEAILYCEQAATRLEQIGQHQYRRQILRDIADLRFRARDYSAAKDEYESLLSNVMPDSEEYRSLDQAITRCNRMEHKGGSPNYSTRVYDHFFHWAPFVLVGDWK